MKKMPGCVFSACAAALLFSFLFCSCGPKCVKSADAPPNEGEACRWDSDCTGGYLCIAETCRKDLASSGQKCLTVKDCKFGLECADGACREKRRAGLGDGCFNDENCAQDASCIASVCTQELSKLDGPCVFNHHCEAGMTCVSGKCSTYCVAASDAGMASKTCYSDYDCPAGSGLKCFNGACVPAAMLAPKEGEYCSTYNKCQPGLFCVAGKCAKSLSAEGGLCNAPGECQQGLYCVAQKCQKTLAAENENCHATADCQSALLCHKGACKPVGTGSIGELCSQKSHCSHPLDCLQSMCTRRKKAGAGETCSDASACTPGLYCINKTCKTNLSMPGGDCEHHGDCDSMNSIPVCIKGKCFEVGHGGKGEICELHEDCNPPLVCVNFKCKKGKAGSGKIGGNCSTDENCNFGYCVMGKCAKDLLPDGSKCKSEMDCASGMCLKGKCRYDYLPAGEKCDANQECMSYICIKGLCANGMSGPGGPCELDDHCELPNICIDGQCANHFSAEGEACSASDDCEAGLSCVKKKCKKQ